MCVWGGGLRGPEPGMQLISVLEVQLRAGKMGTLVLVSVLRQHLVQLPSLKTH